MVYNLSKKEDSFLPEIWAFYGIGALVLLTRFAIRVRTVGIGGFRFDDLFALLVLVFYTIATVEVHIVYFLGTNIEGIILTSMGYDLSQPQLDQLREGSKNQMVAWYTYVTLLWCLKGTMITFYLRLTSGVGDNRFVKVLGIACIVGYIAVILTISFSCWPFYKNFQIFPIPGEECVLKKQNFITLYVFNVFLDAAILYVPIPLLWTLQVPLRKKIAIGILLSSGVFVIGAATARIGNTLSPGADALIINRWGVREVFVSVVAVNAPVLRPLFVRGFWTGDYQSSRGHSIGNEGLTTIGGTPGANSSSRKKSKGGGHQLQPHGPYELASSITSHARFNSITGSEESLAQKGIMISDGEAIMPDPVMSAGGFGARRPSEGAVMVQTEYQITEEERTESSHARGQWGEQGVHKATVSGARSPV